MAGRRNFGRRRRFRKVSGARQRTRHRCTWRKGIDMDAMECLFTRRSVRRFHPDPVPEKALEQMLRAAAYAPSAKNTQSWRFVVLRDKARDGIIDLLEERARDLEGRIHSAAGSVRAMREAPLLITVHNTGALVRMMRVAKDRGGAEGDRERVRSLLREAEIQGVSAAIQNMLLAAHALGLGGLWIGDVHYAREEIESALSAHCPHPLVAAVALGYPAQKPRQPERNPARVTVTLEALEPDGSNQ